MIKKRKQKTKTKRAIKESFIHKLSEAPLTIGLLQHEIDAILETHKPSEPNRAMEHSIMKELAGVLPRDEKIISKNLYHHDNIIVKSMAERAGHSPFVLDLTDLIAKKKKTELSKQRVHSFFSSMNEQSNTPSPCRAEQTADATGKKIVLLKKETEQISQQSKNKKEKLDDQMTPEPWFYHFNLPLNWHRSVIIYLAVCLMIVAPIKAFGYYQQIKKSQKQITAYAASAYADLKMAGQELASDGADRAKDKFVSANQNFLRADEELNQINSSIKAIINILPTDSANLSDAAYLLEAGEETAKIGETLSQIFVNFKNQDGTKMSARVAELSAAIFTLTPRLHQLKDNLDKIRPAAIPADRSAQFQQIKKYINLLTGDMEELESFSKSISQILGVDYKRRYLFIFQNNNELRPTGGFMGSFALVDIDRGEVTNLEVPGGGTYDLQGSLLKRVASPEPLGLVNARWEMQDANWFPDFPTSAKKIQWFYENSGGPSVDGVIAINASLIPALLQITGPIVAPSGQVFQADNFARDLQTMIDAENKTAKDHQPKKVLVALAPELIKKILASRGEDLLKILSSLKTGLNEKDVQLYFNDPSLQEKISSYGWAGEILDSSKDYLAVVNANIGGGKTDTFIEQKINLESTIEQNGDIFNTVTITRRHTGDPNDQFGKISNLSYVRIYTPSGSQLIYADGWSEVPETAFEKPTDDLAKDEFLQKIQGKIKTDPESRTNINAEFNKTVFGNWLQTDAGEEKMAIIKYKLPWRLNMAQEKKSSFLNRRDGNDFYSLFIQKQSGQQNTIYHLRVNLPEGRSISRIYPDDLTPNNPLDLDTADKENALIAFTLN